ncbi:MAG: transglutaminase family protein [Pirellulales bacterium]|nr:transglutaminase family protein [Pirellulales bacterium]
MHYHLRHTTKYSYGESAPVCQNLIRLRPRDLPWQRVLSHRLVIAPEPAGTAACTDYFGNQVEYFAIEEPHRGLAVTATSEVVLTSRSANSEHAPGPAWEEVVAELTTGAAANDPEVQQFRYSSPYVPVEERYGKYARPAFAPGRGIVAALREFTTRMHAEFQFDQRATHVGTTVGEAFDRRAGVCQDFAHVQISCLRSLGLAARYVSGYLRTSPPAGKPRLVGADASHAWVGAYCGSLGWIDFDPTNDVPVDLDHVTVAYGRDYGDISPFQGVILGGGAPVMSVAVDVVPHGEDR